MERTMRAGVRPSTRHGSVDIDPVVVRRSRDLFDRAEVLFDNAEGVPDSAERFRQLYLAALRAAGAALEVFEPSVRPIRRRGGRSAWSRLPGVVPDLAAHAEYFAARSAMRQDVESGLVREVGIDSVIAMRARVMDLLDDVDGILIAYEQGKLPHQIVHVDRSA